jgi:hypothetical protein
MRWLKLVQNLCDGWNLFMIVSSRCNWFRIASSGYKWFSIKWMVLVKNRKKWLESLWLLGFMTPGASNHNDRPWQKVRTLKNHVIYWISCLFFQQFNNFETKKYIFHWEYLFFHPLESTDQGRRTIRPTLATPLVVNDSGFIQWLKLVHDFIKWLWLIQDRIWWLGLVQKHI